MNTEAALTLNCAGHVGTPFPFNCTDEYYFSLIHKHETLTALTPHGNLHNGAFTS